MKICISQTKDAYPPKKQIFYLPILAKQNHEHPPPESGQIKCRSENLIPWYVCFQNILYSLQSSRYAPTIITFPSNFYPFKMFTALCSDSYTCRLKKSELSTPTYRLKKETESFQFKLLDLLFRMPIFC